MDWRCFLDSVEILPLTAGNGFALVQEVLRRHAKADLFDLPVLIPRELDAVPCLTAAQISTDDPDTGIDNTSTLRCAADKKRRMTFPVFKASHDARKKPKFRACWITRPEAALAEKADITITDSAAHGFIADLEADQFCIP